MAIYELYAPVACINSVRILLTVATKNGYEVYHLDIKGSFLYAELPGTEEIWISLPNIPGTSAFGSVVKLRKSLCGLRQAPKLCYGRLSDTLHKVGFRRSTVNDCLFIRQTFTDSIYLLVYVDDLLIVGNSKSVYSVNRTIASTFKVSYLGPCTHFLDLKVQRLQTGIFLSQEKYAENILEIVGMENANPTQRSLPLSLQLYKNNKATDADRDFLQRVPYREIPGSLFFLTTRTRP